MLPEAFIAHQIDNRLRLRIPDHKGDGSFFDKLHNRLTDLKLFDRVETNPTTGSVLLEQKGLNRVFLSGLAADEKLFHLAIEPGNQDSIAERVAASVGALSHQIREFTGGDLDLPEALFIGLLSFGLYEIARGKFKTPPWFTAFWYAFGIFSKSIIDRASEKRSADEQAESL